MADAHPNAEPTIEGKKNKAHNTVLTKSTGNTAFSLIDDFFDTSYRPRRAAERKANISHIAIKVEVRIESPVQFCKRAEHHNIVSDKKNKVSSEEEVSWEKT